jgi:RNA polymerase sigma factor (sigma-70 family)
MMTTRYMNGTEATDAQLVSECLLGNRDAFARIVARYQSLVCSLAYSATGCLGQSEDLAQETFITAWKHLRQLNEPGKLRAWLCGIARNRINNSLRREGRKPLAVAESLELAHDTPAPEVLPSDHAINQEEEAILWRSLERIPENYREPLILFYREHQSIARVAEQLELSEDAVKQRLSRGRRLLHEQMLAFVEGALERTAPGRAFTLSVVAALPVFATSATAATMGATAANGGSVAKASALLGISGAILGPLIGILGAWLGVKASLANAQSERERQFIRRSARISLTLVIVFCVVFCSLIFVGNRFWKTHPLAITTGLIALSIAYVIALFSLILGHNRQLRQIRAEEAAAGRAEPPPASSPMQFEYRSKRTLLGLPLIHACSGLGPDGKRRVAKGWFAYGDIAYGVIAVGGVSVGVISLGGLAFGLIGIGGAALGLVGFGGVAVGGLTFAGLAIGYWAIGGCAVGYLAYGGSALAWHAAMGGAAVAREFALGGAAFAPHANDAVAMNAIRALPFFQNAKFIMANLSLLAWLPMGVLIWQGLRMRKMQRQRMDVLES